MVILGFQWLSVFSGYCWLSMVIVGFQQLSLFQWLSWLSLVFSGYPWFLVVSMVILVFNGYRYGFQWRNFQWLSLVF